MQNQFVISILALVALLASAPILFAQNAKQPESAKAPASASTPDFSGVWQAPTVGQTSQTDNFPGAKGRGFSFSIEEPPMQPWAAEKFKANHDPAIDPHEHGRIEMDPAMRCFPPGPTWLLSQPRPFEIVQIPGRVLMIFEWDHWIREIWTDGRGHPKGKDQDPTWMGHSIGKWDGDTLVVDTIGLNDKTWIDMAGHPHSDALHVVERIHRLNHDVLVDDLTFDDPKAYTRTWTGQQVFRLHPTWQVQEHIACEDHLLHEHGSL
jgi:hypothetical protein